MSHVFGPVPSRRLGRSLGVDLVPFKTCSFDCIYCQLGRTTNKTIERREWVPLDVVLAEVKEKLAAKPDYITLSGSGEPTLYARLGALIDGIRAMTDTPIAVLTNASLLWQEEVRRELRDAHLVAPSLDAGSAGMYEAVNRPHAEATFDRLVSGLVDFRREYAGQMWLEVLLVGGYTADVAEVERIRQCVNAIRPDRVQVNTVVRPPAESYAAGVTPERLQALAELLDPKAEVVCDFQGVHRRAEFAATAQTVLQMLERRPCTVNDVAEGLGIHRNEAIKYIEDLASAGRAEAVQSASCIYYRASAGASG